MREVAILCTGAQLTAGYEIYAHQFAGHAVGLSRSQVAELASGRQPPDLRPDEVLAYRVATTLAGGASLAESTYQAASATFGASGCAELIYLVGAYCLLAVLLNGYDVRSPETDPDGPG